MKKAAISSFLYGQWEKVRTAKIPKKEKTELTATQKRNRARKICLGIASITILIVTVMQIIGSFRSTAYLYDENDIGIDYSVAQLKFDLSSNHMYYYYSADPDYQREFSNLLTGLSTDMSYLESGNLNAASFRTSVMTKMNTFYPAGFCTELDEAYENNKGDQAAFVAAARQIYNKYSSQTQYIFNMKDILLSKIDERYGIWYYYVQDLINLYMKEYVVQKSANGTNTSTINIAVKLKGGTTFSEDTGGEYYDDNFQDMVQPLNLKLENTGNANMYVAFSLTMDAAREKGIAGIVLPYQMNLSDLTAAGYDGAYASCVKDGVIDYRAFLSNLLYNAESGGYITGSDTVEQIRKMAFADLFALIQRFNAYSIKTYYSENGAAQNRIVCCSGEENLALNCGMLFFADYSTCKDYYNQQYPNKDQTKDNWGEDDDYLLDKYQFTVHIRSSLRNLQNLSSIDADDALWNEHNNAYEQYEKYAGVSNFDVEGFAYFLQDDQTREAAKQDMSGGYIICNYTDPGAHNYIGRLRLNVDYRGFSPAYIRVRYIEQFTNTAGEIVAVNQLKYKKGDNWVDNRYNDLYFYSPKLYYSVEKDVMTTTNQAKKISIPVIEGLSDDYLTDGKIDLGKIDETLKTNSGLTLRLSISVEAVQPNRIKEFFGKEAWGLPTADATPDSVAGG